MTYAGNRCGKADLHPSGAGRVRLGPDFMAFDDVEARLIEAMLLWRRSPDRERGWLHVKAFWPEIQRAGCFRVVGGEVDYPEEEPMPRPLPLTRAEVQAMTEASDWMALVPERDRKLVALGVAALAGGAKRIPWSKLKPALGVKLGEHGLRKRYCRAVAGIAAALNNGGNAQGSAVKGQDAGQCK